HERKERPAVLRDRIVWSLLICTEDPIFKWNNFGTSRVPPTAYHPAKLNKQGRRALVRDETKNLMITLAEL
uniref:Uncharacterized protein n=1 Tax=Scophthalmus maximus TaxID=52904 RepID=A0A8D3E4J9_SCOMX